VSSFVDTFSEVLQDKLCLSQIAWLHSKLRFVQKLSSCDTTFRKSDKMEGKSKLADGDKVSMHMSMYGFSPNTHRHNCSAVN
jgi:hypothetical protein